MPRVIAAQILVILLVIFQTFCAAGEPTPACVIESSGGDSPPPPEIENVFIVIIDGIRNSEAFGDPTHTLIPRIWNDLKPLGTIYRSFFNAGHTKTSPGHATITSGVTQFFPNTLSLGHEDIVRVQEEPSIFQYYREQLGIPEEKTWIVNGKGGMIRYTGLSQNPFFRSDFAPSLSFHDLRSDDDTWIEVQRVIDTFHPSLTMINLADVDECGHSGKWELYTQAIRHADRIVYDLCQKIWSDPHYEDNTAIIITSDHGRHVDGLFGGFIEHGCSCIGCRSVPFLAIGPGIRRNATVYRPGYLCDIAPTVAYLLGFDAIHARGRILRELFDTPPAEEPPSLVDPVIAATDERIHLAACRLHDGSSSIVYSHMDIRGARQKGYMVLSEGTNDFAPSIAVDDCHVAVAWTCYRADGSCRIRLRESKDGGASWGQGYFTKDVYAFWEDLCPSVSFCNGELRVLWTESRVCKGAVNMAVSRDGGDLRTETLIDRLVERPRGVPGSGGTHTVVQRLVPEQKNFDIQYCRHTERGWLSPVVAGTTPGESLRPDLAFHKNRVHMVWGENDNNHFRLLSCSSPDGMIWSDPVEICSAGFGSWRPRLAASKDRLCVIWEGYQDAIPGLFVSSSADGGASWSRAVRLTPVGEPASGPAMVLDDENMLHLVWTRGFRPAGFGWMSYQL